MYRRRSVVASVAVGRRQRKRISSSPSDERVAVAGSPASSGRYTPSSRAFRIRPGRHKVFGVLQLIVGLAIIVLNYADYWDVNLLPGGHQEIYFVLGLLLAGGSIWWFGWFDRSPSPEEIRRLYYSEKR